MPATPAQTLLESASCFSCLGMSQFEAMLLTEWDLISQNIAPAVETFHILSNVGDSLISQVGDNLVYQ